MIPGTSPHDIAMITPMTPDGKPARCAAPNKACGTTADLPLPDRGRPGEQHSSEQDAGSERSPGGDGAQRPRPSPPPAPRRQLVAAANIPASYEPPFWWVITASRFAALIMATRQISAATWSSS
ncbi:hypothetical protein RKD29_002636 [Streptomyces tendae]